MAKESRDLLVAWRVSMRPTGEFMAQRIVFDKKAIVSLDERACGGIPQTAEMACRDMIHISRELWDRAWSRDRAAEYETLSADALALLQQHQEQDDRKGTYEAQLKDWDVRIEHRRQMAPKLPEAATVVGKLLWTDGSYVDEATLHPSKRFLATEVETREACLAQVAHMEDARSYLRQEYDTWLRGVSDGSSIGDKHIQAGLTRAKALKTEGRLLATEVATDVKGRQWR